MARAEILLTNFAAKQVSKSRLPGEPGVWIFIAIDMGFFSLLFLSYVIGEWGDFSGFGKSQLTLETNYGLLNTLILLTSSFLVALAVQAARLGKSRLASRLTLAGAILGAGFLAIKAVEYTHKFEAGIFLTTNNFFMYYFIVTFLHALHVFAGAIVLVTMAWRIGKNQVSPADIKWLESAGIFWHTVDFLWVIIFALFYLISWR